MGRSQTIDGRIEAWLAGALRTIKRTRRSTTHVDRLGIRADSASSLQLCRHALQRTVSNVLRYRNLIAGLAWPLGDNAKRIVTTIPTHLPLWGKKDEPPTLYVIHRSEIARFWFVEQYERGLSASMYGFSDESVVAYYRCFRTKPFIENDWEFSRALYFEGRPIKDRILY